MAEACHCGFGEEYFTIEGARSLCAVCGGEVRGPQPAVAQQPAPAAAKRILVIDDQPFFRTRLRDILEGRGHAVVEAGEGLDAVRAVAAGLRPAPAGRAAAVDVAILDLTMPGLLDGFQTLGVLKAMDEDLPVLILTASPPTADLLKKLGQLKAKKYLNKSSKNLDELILRNLDSV